MKSSEVLADQLVKLLRLYSLSSKYWEAKEKEERGEVPEPIGNVVEIRRAAIRTLKSARDDSTKSIENSIRIFKAEQQRGVSFRLEVFGRFDTYQREGN